jgi:hypothetical protein
MYGDEMTPWDAEEIARDIKEQFGPLLSESFEEGYALGLRHGNRRGRDGRWMWFFAGMWLAAMLCMALS